MKEPRTPGDRAAVIAVRRAGDGDPFGELPPAPLGKRRRGHRAGARFADEFGEQPKDGIGTAERLEALEPEALSLVLVEERLDAERSGGAAENAQRRRRVTRPGCDLAVGGGETDGVERGLKRRAVEGGARHGAMVMKMRDRHSAGA
jgi:hypothetical protein